MSIFSLSLSDITQYTDVEIGRLELASDDRRKCWQAVWLTDLRCDVCGSRCLPRMPIPLFMRHYEQWIDCPVLMLNRRNRMAIVPLKTTNWYDFGIDLYLCADGDGLVPLSSDDYLLFCEAVKWCRVKQMVVEPPRQVVGRCFLQHDMGMEQNADFWDFY